MDDSDYNSDGSDYDPERDEEEALEEKDDDVDVHINDTGLARMGTNGIVIQDVPIPNDYSADPYQISVAQLEDQIRYHIRKGILHVALTKVDITSKVFSNPKYPRREIQLGKDRHPPRETRYQVVQKTYGTPLHYACRDPNGSRGEHKIRLLLWVANHYKIPISEILSLPEVTVRKYGTEWHELNRAERKEEMNERRATPFYILLDNQNASINAIRLMAEAWPTIVRMQYFTDVGMECHNTLHHVLLQAPVSPDHEEEDGSRILAIVKILLEAAAKTKLGAKGLIAANTQEFWENIETWNAIHVALSRPSLPLEILTTMLQIWPEAVQESGNGYSSGRPCPLYAILNHRPQTTRACLWQAQCIEAIFQHSSLESVVTGLVRADDDGRTEFQAFLEVVHQLQASGESELADSLLDTFNSVIDKRDAHGRTMLHHVVVAPDFQPPPPLEYHRSMANIFKRLRKKRVNHQVELIQWILEKDPSQAWVRDNEGHNALHVALKSGGTWHDGIRAMIELVPDWQYEPIKVDGEQEDLLPFQIAAAAVDARDGAVGTIYELLKITGPRAFSDVILFKTMSTN